MIKFKDFLPDGKSTEAKNNQQSNLYKILNAIDLYVEIMNTDIDELKNEMSPDTTTALIDRWEYEVGIPNECFYKEGTIEQRRLQVLSMILAPYAYTEAGLQALFNLWGEPFVIHYGVDIWSIDVSVALKPTGVAPVCDTGSGVCLDCRSPLICLLQKIKPAQTRLIINYVL